MDYGFKHEGPVYTPNGTPGIAAEDNDARNARIEQAEMEAWQTRPSSFVAYFNFPAEAGLPRTYRASFNADTTGATLATWTGRHLAKVISARVYLHNFGGRFVAVTAIGSNGARYQGRASWDNGNVIRIRKAK